MPSSATSRGYERNAALFLMLSRFRVIWWRQGSSPEAFAEAHEHFVIRLWAELDIPRQSFFIVPGNHDVDRTVVRRAQFVELGLKGQLNSTASTNAFIDQTLNGENSICS